MGLGRAKRRRCKWRDAQEAKGQAIDFTDLGRIRPGESPRDGQLPL